MPHGKFRPYANNMLMHIYLEQIQKVTDVKIKFFRLWMKIKHCEKVMDGLGGAVYFIPNATEDSIKHRNLL